jgi:hypothetical protein
MSLEDRIKELEETQCRIANCEEIESDYMCIHHDIHLADLYIKELEKQVEVLRNQLANSEDTIESLKTDVRWYEGQLRIAEISIYGYAD